MKQCRLTESELIRIIENTVADVLSDEENINEGFLDNIKSGIKGARQGYNTQKMKDADNLNNYRYKGRVGNNYNGLNYGAQTDNREDALDGRHGYKAMIQQAREYEALAKELRAKAAELAQAQGIKRGFQGQAYYTPDRNVAKNKRSNQGAKNTKTLADIRRSHVNRDALKNIGWFGN